MLSISSLGRSLNVAMMFQLRIEDGELKKVAKGKRKKERERRKEERWKK